MEAAVERGKPPRDRVCSASILAEVLRRLLMFVEAERYISISPGSTSTKKTRSNSWTAWKVSSPTDSSTKWIKMEAYIIRLRSKLICVYSNETTIFSTLFLLFCVSKGKITKWKEVPGPDRTETSTETSDRSHLIVTLHVYQALFAVNNYRHRSALSSGKTIIRTEKCITFRILIIWVESSLDMWAKSWKELPSA
jgi:hypothetical protein